MHAQEFKVLSAISAFCLMAFISLGVASFVYTNTQDHLLQEAQNNNLQIASNTLIQDKGLSTQA